MHILCPVFRSLGQIHKSLLHTQSACTYRHAHHWSVTTDLCFWKHSIRVAHVLSSCVVKFATLAQLVLGYSNQSISISGRLFFNAPSPHLHLIHTGDLIQSHHQLSQLLCFTIIGVWTISGLYPTFIWNYALLNSTCILDVHILGTLLIEIKCWVWYYWQ